MCSCRMWSFSTDAYQRRLKTVATTDTLVEVMRSMSDMMGKANKNMNITSIEQALTVFQTEMERGNIMAEQIEDVMNTG